MRLNRNELRKILYDFNSFSNRLLQADFQDYTDVLKKFLNFINNTPIIFDYILDCVLRIFCPSCGLTSENYVTEDVIDLAMRMIKNTANDKLYAVFKKLERYNKRNSTIKFKAGKRIKHETEDPICSGIEALEVANFPCCKRTVKIKPLLKMTGAYCPFCGVKNYEIE